MNVTLLVFLVPLSAFNHHQLVLGPIYWEETCPHPPRANEHTQVALIEVRVGAISHLRVRRRLEVIASLLTAGFPNRTFLDLSDIQKVAHNIERIK